MNEPLQARLNDEQEVVRILAKLAMSNDKPYSPRSLALLVYRVYAQIERRSKEDDW